MRASMLLSLSMLHACDPTLWDALERRASVYVIESPGGPLAGDFGASVSATEATVGGARSSFFAVGGGSDGGSGAVFYLYPGFEDAGGPMGRPRFSEAAQFVACDMMECSPGFGASVVAFPEWRATTGTFHGCVAAPSARDGQIQIRCVDQLPTYQTARGAAGERFGAVAAAVATPEHPQHRVGVALFGAPGANGGDGALYRLANGALDAQRIDLSAARAPGRGAIGTSVAVAPIDARSALFATGTAYPSDTQRVIVGLIDVDDEGVSTVTVRGCLQGPRGWGRALALGDLNGDDVLDLVVSVAEDAVEQRIDVWSGAELPASTSCDDAQPAPTVTLRCGDVIPEGETRIVCGEPLGFGAALAIGDVDADGVNDLVVGAPRATVLGRANAGALFAIAGSRGSLADLGERTSVLTFASQAEGGRLGASLALLRGPGEHREIVAGAPGAKQVALFVCSGLGSDVPGDRPFGCL